MQFHAELSWSASTNKLNTTIWADNVGTDTARIQTGQCAFNVIAYDGHGNPVWYNRPPPKYICLDEKLIYELAPKKENFLPAKHISAVITGTGIFPKATGIGRSRQ